MSNKEHPTSNIQRPTSNGPLGRSKAYDLEERLLSYAVRVIRLVDALPRSRGGDHMGGQLLRAGTSPTLNHGEVQAAESAKDFIHKLKICLKELRESRRALSIIRDVPLTKDLTEVEALTNETEQLIRIFFTSVQTAQRRLLARDKTSVLHEDPGTGGDDWMLDVERWMLDVFDDTQHTQEDSLR